MIKAFKIGFGAALGVMAAFLTPGLVLVALMSISHAEESAVQPIHQMHPHFLEMARDNLAADLQAMVPAVGCVR